MINSKLTCAVKKCNNMRAVNKYNSKSINKAIIM